MYGTAAMRLSPARPACLTPPGRQLEGSQGRCVPRRAASAACQTRHSTALQGGAWREICGGHGATRLSVAGRRDGQSRPVKRDATRGQCATTKAPPTPGLPAHPRQPCLGQRPLIAFTLVPYMLQCTAVALWRRQERPYTHPPTQSPIHPYTLARTPCPPSTPPHLIQRKDVNPQEDRPRLQPVQCRPQRRHLWPPARQGVRDAQQMHGSSVTMCRWGGGTASNCHCDCTA